MDLNTYSFEWHQLRLLNPFNKDGSGLGWCSITVALFNSVLHTTRCVVFSCPVAAKTRHFHASVPARMLMCGGDKVPCVPPCLLQGKTYYQDVKSLTPLEAEGDFCEAEHWWKLLCHLHTPKSRVGAGRAFGPRGTSSARTCISSLVGFVQQTDCPVSSSGYQDQLSLNRVLWYLSLSELIILFRAEI